MVTRYTVALDAGGELQLVRQNVEGASADAAPEQGKEVLVGWRPEHAAAVRAEVNERGGLHHEEKERTSRPDGMAGRRRPGRVHARSSPAAARSSDSSTGGSGNELQKLGKGEGEAQPDLLGRLRRTGMDQAVRTENRLQGQRQGRRHLRRNGRADGTGQYDGVSASGNATARLVAAGEVDPVNVSLVPNYKTIFSDLKDQPYNTFEGVHYGIPHGRGANLLMWNSDDVKPAPDSWDVTLDPKVAAKYKGKISQYDDPMSIAEAAVYLKVHEPDLGIENPYELNEEQFEAAVNLLKEQQANVGEYWSDAAKQIPAFASGDNEVGTTWQYQYFALRAKASRSPPARRARASCPRRARRDGRTPG